MQFKAWKIENNHFVKEEFSENKFCRLIRIKLKDIVNASIYIRGSMLELENPPECSDIDLYVIFEKKIDFTLLDQIKQRISSFGRTIDFHFYTTQNLSNNLPEMLLFHTRSLYINGPVIEYVKVKADKHLIHAYWKAYNVNFAPNIMYSNLRSRVCALKNLTRCFGLIKLIELNLFTRDIKECLDYAKKKENKIHQILKDNWNIVGQKKPMNLKEIKEYLMDYQNNNIEKKVH